MFQINKYGTVLHLVLVQELSLCLMLAGFKLEAYTLDSLRAQADNNDVPPVWKLTNAGYNGWTSCFNIERVGNQVLVFFREGVTNYVQVLEAINPNASGTVNPKRGFLEKLKNKEDFYFRKLKKLDIRKMESSLPDVGVLKDQICLMTYKHFQLFDRGLLGVPNGATPSYLQTLEQIKSRKIPLRIFKQLEHDWLFCYRKSAHFLEKQRSLIPRNSPVSIEYVSEAKSVALSGNHLMVFHTDFLENRDIRNGEMVQVIPGMYMKCTDDGMDGDIEKRNVKFVMDQPELQNTQLFLELYKKE